MPRAPKQRKLTPKQRAFKDEYLVDLNAAAAARRAGYSEKTADRIGHELLKKPEIAEAIRQALEERSKRTEITADRVLQELALLAFANTLDYHRIVDGEPVIDLSALTRDQAAALSELSVDDYLDGRGPDARQVRRVKVKLADKKAALELLGKHLGLFTDRVENTHKFEGMTALHVHAPEPAPHADDDGEDDDT